MKKDIVTKSFVEHSDVFADIANVNLFGGRQVLMPKDLEAVPTETNYKDLDGGHHVLVRDSLQRVQKLGGYIAFIGYENQTGINNVMPIRDMGYTYTAYMKQIRAIIADNNKKRHSAFTKVIHDDQKLLPVVTCVLYYGIQPWDKPLTLLDVLDIPEHEREFWKEMVGDYKIHVIFLVKQPKEVREQYKSDFRIVADYLAYYDDEKQLLEEWRKNNQALIHPEQLLDMLEAISGDRKIHNIKEKFLINGKQKEEINMTSFIDMIEQDGMQKGMQRGIEQGLGQGLEAMVHTLKEFCLSSEEIFYRVVKNPEYSDVTLEQVKQYF